jgi:hypothetical protein
MRKTIFFLLFIPLWGFSHSSQLSTFALVKDEKGVWTAHFSASLSAFQAVLADQKINSPEEFQKSLIQWARKSIHISAGLLHPILLEQGSVYLGHQTDVKFTLKGMPSKVESFSVENQILRQLSGHAMVFKVIYPASESNQVVLTSSNDFSANVLVKPTGIFIEPKPGFTYLYLLLIFPFILLCLYLLKRRSTKG